MADNSDIDSLSSEEDEEEVESTDSEKEPVVEDEDLIQKVEVPKDIKVDASIIGISCHPKRNLIATGTVDGTVYLYSYSNDSENKLITSYEHHKQYCRCVDYSESGDYLFTGAQDALIYVIDLETQSEHRKFSRTDGSPVYSLLPIDNFLLAAGEDDGEVVIWDIRMSSPVACFEDCSEYISSLAVNSNKKTLLATSGEGLIVSYNIKTRKQEMQSKLFDCDFLSMGIYMHGNKVAVGSSDGALNIFNWAEFGNIVDRFSGHPGSVDALEVISEDVVCTGCEDGKVRAVQLNPNRFLGVLGHHNGFSIESLSMTHDTALLASSSHDQVIKFWDLSPIDEAKAESVEDAEREKTKKPKNDFFSDLA